MMNGAKAGMLPAFLYAIAGADDCLAVGKAENKCAHGLVFVLFLLREEDIAMIDLAIGFNDANRRQSAFSAQTVKIISTPASVSARAIPKTRVTPIPSAMSRFRHDFLSGPERYRT